MNAFDSFHTTTNVISYPVSPIFPSAGFLVDDATETVHLWPSLSPATSSTLSPASFAPARSSSSSSSSYGSAAPSLSFSSSADLPLTAAVPTAVEVGAGNSSSPQRLPRRRLCKRACVACRNAKTSCDDSRPCARCRTQRDPTRCFDRPQEEIERGRLKRRRKQNVSAQLIPRQPPQQHDAALRYDLGPPYPSSALPLPSLMSGSGATQQSSAACLAAAQSTGTRNLLLAIAEQVMCAESLSAAQRKKAIRAVHFGLAHMADHLNLHDFNAFLQGQPTKTIAAPLNTTAPASLQSPPDSLSSTPMSTFSSLPSPISLPVVPVPTILHAWSHRSMRPFFLEWSSTPMTCVTTDEGSDANVATVRILFLPQSKLNVLRWESEQTNHPMLSTDAGPETTDGASADSSFAKTDGTNSAPIAAPTITHVGKQIDSHIDRAISAIDAQMACLTMNDTSASATTVLSTPPSSSTSDPSTAAVVCFHDSHASWCGMQQLLPSSFDMPSSTLLPVCTCRDSVALPSTMLVNAAWERLFGYSQAEVRCELLRCGLRAASVWHRLDSWFAYHVLLSRHMQSASAGSDFRTFSIVRTKWGTELSCLVQKQIVCGDDGFTSSTIRFTPITAKG